jgi:uncharacterized protein (TIGR03118 family)
LSLSIAIKNDYHLGATMTLRSLLLATAAFTTLTGAALAESKPVNQYKQTIFVANKKSYKPQIAVEKTMINAWGIAIRPKGAGGHFWVTAKDTSFQYVGDVSQSPDKSLQKLSAPDIQYVKLPVGGDDKFATSVVFSGSKKDFVITQNSEGKDAITSPAKFLFASDGGIISAWTERKNADGSFDRTTSANSVIDLSKDGVQFFGLAINQDNSKLYAANFGDAPDIRVFDGDFKPSSLSFDMPFDDNKNGKVDAGEYAPFNVQNLTTPEGKHHIFVTYAKTQPCPKDAIKKGDCKAGDVFAGEEDTSKDGYGRLAEFNEDGKLIAVWNDGGKLSAPWGMAFAPENFGALSGKLLVGNFGSGTISAFDPTTRTFTDVIRNTKGKPVIIDKLWGILFGNGESLGDNNTLYFAAGPKDETDGLFGSLKQR